MPRPRADRPRTVIWRYAERRSSLPPWWTQEGADAGRADPKHQPFRPTREVPGIEPTRVAKLISADAAGDNRSTEGRRVAPLTSAELISNGVRPELLASLALRRVASGRVAKWGDHYSDWDRPTPSYLGGIFDELASTGLLALAEQQGHPGLRVSLTPAGRLRREQLRAVLRRVGPEYARTCRGAV